MEIEITHKRLYRSLLNMVEWTKQCQKNFIDLKYLSMKAWVKEQATVEFTLPRQSGHTTFAIKLLQEYFKNAILIVPNESVKSHTLHNHNISTDFRRRISTFSNLQKFYGLNVEAVIVDCASLMSLNTKENIYEFFIPYVKQEPFLFIFLE